MDRALEVEDHAQDLCVPQRHHTDRHHTARAGLSCRDPHHGRATAPVNQGPARQLRDRLGRPPPCVCLFLSHQCMVTCTLSDYKHTWTGC